VVIEFKGKDLSSLSYWDQMENKVSYQFEDWKKDKMSLDQFEYTPPKNSTVTHL
jgi:outer membrane lipoprotein-sorting protein